MSKRLLAVLLALAMVLTAAPAVFATEADVATWAFATEEAAPEEGAYVNVGTLQEAFAAANANEDAENPVAYVKLTADVTKDPDADAFTLQYGKIMVLDLCEKTITGESGDGDDFLIGAEEDSKLTIMNGTLRFTGEGYSDTASVWSEGSLKMVDCDVTVSGEGWVYGVYAWDQLDLVDCDVTVSTEETAYGAISDGKMSISGGKIQVTKSDEAPNAYAFGASVRNELTLINNPVIQGEMADFFIESWDNVAVIKLTGALSGDHLPFTVYDEMSAGPFTSGASAAGINAQNFSDFFAPVDESMEVFMSGEELQVHNKLYVYYMFGSGNNDMKIEFLPLAAQGMVPKPADPVKEGYTFVGWYTDILCTKEFDFNTPIIAPAQLLGKWTFDATEFALSENSVNLYIPVGTTAENIGEVAEKYLGGVRATAKGAEDQLLDGLHITDWKLKEGESLTGKNLGDTVTLVGTVVHESLPYIDEDRSDFSSFGVQANWTGEKTVEVPVSLAHIVMFNYGYKTETVIIREEGQTVRRPSYNPQHEINEFVGWYVEGNDATEYDFSSVITNSLTICAKWEAPAGYVKAPDGNMAYAIKYDGYDIIGLFGGMWRSSSYNLTYETRLKVGDKVEYIYIEEGGFTTESGLNIDIKVDFASDGKTVQIEYIVKDTRSEGEDIQFSLGTGADVQIGEDDGAIIQPLFNAAGKPTGFKMVSAEPADRDSETGEYVQFNFFGKGYEGVTSVSDFWFGPYGGGEYQWAGNEDEATFYGFEQSVSGADISGRMDSAASWHWDGTIEAGQTKTFSLCLGIGGAGSENAISVGGLTAPTGSVKLDLNEELTSSSQLSVTVGDQVLTENEDYTVDLTDPDKPVITFTEAAGLNISSGDLKVSITSASGSPTSIDVENNIPASGNVAAQEGSLEGVVSENLNNVANMLEKDLELTVKAEEATASDAEQAAIEQLAEDKVLVFLDIVLKDVNTKQLITNTGNQLVQITIPFDKEGKDPQSIAVYRVHDENGNGQVDDGEAVAMTKDPADGQEGFTVGEDSITIYAKKFSTYAVGYTVAAHTCAPGEEWKFDETNHWKECAVTGCGAVIENTKAAHSDSNADGKCDVCGQPLNTGDTIPETGDGSRQLWFWLLGMSCAGILAVVACDKKRRIAGK